MPIDQDPMPKQQGIAQVENIEKIGPLQEFLNFISQLDEKEFIEVRKMMEIANKHQELQETIKNLEKEIFVNQDQKKYEGSGGLTRLANTIIQYLRGAGVRLEKGER